MALTDPFPAGVEAWLKDPIEHLYQVTVLPVGGEPFEVAVVDRLEVTYDLDWTPFCQVRLTIKTPTSSAQEAALDGRLGTRLEVLAGYRHAGTRYWTRMARLRLHTQSTPRPGGTTDLTAHGLEIVLQEQGSIPESPPQVNESTGQVTWQDQYTDRTGVVPFLRSWINRAYEPGPKPGIAVVGVPDGAWNSALVSQYQHGGGSNWSAIEGVARAAGVRVFDNGLEQWRIEAMPALTQDYAARLRTGKHGTVTTADTTVDRSRWFNAVQVTWKWPAPPDAPVNPGQERTMVGLAEVTSGPLRATTLNRKQYRDIREGPASFEYAQAYAQGILRKLFQRGRSRTLTGIAAYWLRPGMTILVKFGTQDFNRVLVSAVTFSPLNGSMAVTTIRPEDYETS